MQPACAEVLSLFAEAPTRASVALFYTVQHKAAACRLSRRGSNLKIMGFLAAHDLHEVGAPGHATNFESVLLLEAGDEQPRGRGRGGGRRGEHGRLLQHLQHKAP